MAVIKSKPIQLYHSKSKLVESPVFFVTPGEVLQLQAFGFACDRTKLDQEERTVPQIAYLEQLMFKEGTLESTETKNNCQCTRLYDKTTELLASEKVMICGHCVTLSAQNNHLLINTPGAYRLVLNDVTALGNVQIFVRTFTKDEFPWNSNLFVGERL